jgi:Fe-S cluster biogenesis protein NfuA
MTEKEQELQEVLDEIRPGIQLDGGDLEFVSFDEDTGIVEIRLHGACVGCPMSSITLKQGVEYMLKQALDFVTEVVDLTDHDAVEPQDFDDDDFRNGFQL